MKRFGMAALGLAATLAASGVQASPMTEPLRPDQLAFRSLYKEMIETNTTWSVGSCTKAAAQVAVRLKAAGFPDADIHLFSDPAYPKNGGIVAILPGQDKAQKAVLLLAHLDVVEAKREDWTRDPFTLFEENGYFYGRGTFDDKYQAAIWADMMVRFKQEGFQPKRTVKMALTCGEEGGDFNGADYLTSHDRDLIDAAFALNEGGGGELDEHGMKVLFGIQSAEKVYQDFQFEVTNPGGHSSQPAPDNAIYHLAAGLNRLAAYDFPVQLNDTTRLYFSRLADIKGGEVGAAMRALLKDPHDKAAEAVLNKNRAWHSMLRTTCVATMLSGGHATNALPQRATANVNCRIFPGQSVPSVLQTLTDVVADPAIKITVTPPQALTPPAAPLTREVMGPIEQAAAEIYPGIPVVPQLETGASDAIFLNSAGIPTYGVEGVFVDPDLGNIHGLNERIGVKELYQGRDYLYKLVKIYAN